MKLFFFYLILLLILKKEVKNLIRYFNEILENKMEMKNCNFSKKSILRKRFYSFISAVFF